MEKKKLLCDVKFLLKNNTLNQILLLGLLSTSTSAAPPARKNVQLQKSCRTSSDIEPARKNEFYQNSEPLDSFFTLLQKESLQKVEALQQNSEFQETVNTLQWASSRNLENLKPKGLDFLNSSDPEQCLSQKFSGSRISRHPNPHSGLNPEFGEGSLDSGMATEGEDGVPHFYIFISFSMGEKALLNLAHEAKRFNAILVLKGFKDGSYVKTAQALQNIIAKTGQGVLIDPELYTLFNVTAVPTYVLAKPFPFQAQERIQTPIHDKLQGHVSVQYALETFVKKGDLKTDARALLKKGAFQ